MILEKIQSMLGSCNSAESQFPPTELYNEGWLLRVLLDWFSEHHVEGHVLSFADGARWYSEGLLPTAFRSERRRDPLGESWTHADGIIGHFKIGDIGRADLRLDRAAAQFVTIEAKLFSRLSKGVSHARYFDQAARTVACMAQVFSVAKIKPKSVRRLGFYVLAPRVQIQSCIFRRQVSKQSIADKVGRRVREYGRGTRKWFVDYFQPLLHEIDVDCLSWERLLADISASDPESALNIKNFYSLCIRFNAPRIGNASKGPTRQCLRYS